MVKFMSIVVHRCGFSGHGILDVDVYELIKEHTDEIFVTVMISLIPT